MKQTKWIKIKELNIEITEIMHRGKNFEEALELKPKDTRLLTFREVIGLMNSDKLDLIFPKKGWSDFFFEQPLKINKEEHKRAIAYRRGSGLGFALGMSKFSKASWRGIIWARNLKKIK